MFPTCGQQPACVSVQNVIQDSDGFVQTIWKKEKTSLAYCKFSWSCMYEQLTDQYAIRMHGRGDPGFFLGGGCISRIFLRRGTHRLFFSRIPVIRKPPAISLLWLQDTIPLPRPLKVTTYMFLHTIAGIVQKSSFARSFFSWCSIVANMHVTWFFGYFFS